MGDLLACRVCLASNNLKLFSFFNYKLAHAYEVLTGTKVSIGDGLPFYICSYCSALLLKCVAFKEKCCNAESLLRYCLEEQNELSMEYIRSLNREIHDLILPYTVTNTIPVISLQHEEIAIKEEHDLQEYKELVIMDDIKSEDESRPKRSKRKRKSKKPEFDMLTVKSEDEIDESINQTLDQCLDESLEHDDVGEDVDDMVTGMKDVEIVTLTRKQQFEEIEARKNSWNYLNSAYKCDKCYKGFMMDSTYGNHMERHDPKRGPYECDICFSRWPEPRSLRAHINNSHRRKYICKLCDFVSRSSYRAKEHCHMHNGYKFVCKICGATFSKSTSHLTHIRLHHPSNHSCEICGESFIGEFGLSMHKKRAHKDRDEEMAPLVCSNDELIFQPPFQFQCQCSAEFQNMDALKRHLESSNNGLCDPDVRPCPKCGYGFSNDESLSEHMKDHQESFHCDDCNRGFASDKSLAVHQQRVHQGVKLKQLKPCLKRPADSVVCEICGKTCITNATLRYHRRIHTGEKPFQCTECPKKFTVQQRLQIHVRTHTGERPYKCKHCPKAFMHKAALNRHDRVHTGVKPYVCAHCGKAFSQSNSMKLHVNTVHLKMPAPYKNRRNKL